MSVINAVANATQSTNANAVTSVSVADTFNVNVPVGVTVNAFTDASHPCVPVVSEHYVFRKDVLRESLAFLNDPMGDAMFVSGPTGSGKTSGMTEICARLNWPVQQVTCSSRLEMADLVGQHTLTTPVGGGQPEMQFQYGPLAIAMKEGHVLILNEIDIMEPGELSGLNDVLEGRPLVIAQNAGEVVYPHPNFRVVATGNSLGSGDESGRYQGVVMQNMAAMDRYRFMVVDYPAHEVEEAILAKVAPALGADIHRLMINVANDLRYAYKSDSDLKYQDANGATKRANLSLTMSTRILVRWAQLAVQFRSSVSDTSVDENGKPQRNSLSYALHIALLRRLSDAEKVAVLQLCKANFPIWHD
nr:AAA family ATPase [uncultured Halomonas sp.]